MHEQDRRGRDSAAAGGGSPAEPTPEVTWFPPQGPPAAPGAAPGHPGHPGHPPVQGHPGRPGQPGPYPAWAPPPAPPVGSSPVGAPRGRSRTPVLLAVLALVAIAAGAVVALSGRGAGGTPDVGAGLDFAGIAGAAAEDADPADRATVTVTATESATRARAADTARGGPGGAGAAPARSAASTRPAGAREDPVDPPCDGRGIIIYQSVYGPNAGEQLNAALDAHPGTVYASPGACASLNPEKDGYPVYAVYKDFGHDREALCAADTGIETNSRIMQDERIYGDYCGK